MQPGSRRRQLDRTLRVAFSEGLLSESTFVARLDTVLGEGTVDPRRLVGDLNLGGAHSPYAAARHVRARVVMWPRRRSTPLLALDWSGVTRERLLIGRAPESDIVVDHGSVSRRHAELLWRSGTWVIHDVGSKNGTALNGRTVTRAQLRAGDYLAFAGRTFRID